MPSEREIRLYYFTAAEIAELAHCGVDYAVRRTQAVGGVRWHDGLRQRMMFPPDAAAKLKKLRAISRRRQSHER